MKYLYLLSILIALSACSSFHQLARKTDVGSKDGYTLVSNRYANIESSTYGDFKFAFNTRQLKKLTTDQTDLDNILFYAKTEKPDYEYYVILNPEVNNIDQEKYDWKDTVIGNNRFIILISKNAPSSDKRFILNHFEAIK